jgi:uncharacterized protein YndB with AHSA1/START domain
VGRPDPSTLRREIRIAAAPGIVFDYLTNAAKIPLWAGTEAASDPRLGGAYRVVINPGHVIAGEYVEVLRPRRIVCTWGWVDSPTIPPGSTVVEIVLRADGRNTVVTLTHAALPERAHEGHTEVWDHYLPRLAAVASGGNPGPDPWSHDAPHATES